MSQQRSAGYTYRPFSPGDTDAFLDLYGTVWGRTADRDWFRWRFESNPYVEEVPMVVAARDGALVGAEPCLAFRLRAGASEVLAFQPADWIVHPDHRRRGVFSGMTRRLLDRYDGGRPALYFNFPSDALVPGLEKFDWRLTDGPSTYYRVQHPGRVAAAIRASDGPLTAAVTDGLGRLADAVARGYFGLRRGGRQSGISVTRHGSVPARRLAALYRRTVPDRIHVLRDAAYYRWRFANPRWRTITYVARRDGVIEAACVVATDTAGELRRASLLDVLPCDGSADHDIYRALLRAVVADAGDADLLRVGGNAIPRAVLGEFGFAAGNGFPLSLLSNSRPLAVRPAAATVSERWTLDGYDPTDGRNWSLALADRDIG